MEFCPQLSAFQGVIISADNVHPFSRLNTRGGNEEKIKYITDSIIRFFDDNRYTTSDGFVKESIGKIRKFAFFLILNSDLSVLSDMTDMEEIELVIWTIPTIPKCLMCEIFWRLHLDKFVYESIAFCDPELSSEIASAFLDNIKYYTPIECLDKISVISAALYKLICRIYFFNFFSNTLTDKLTMIFSNLEKAINFFVEPPKQDSLNRLSKDDQYKYIGNCLKTMLLLLNQCFDEFMMSQELTAISDPIYMLSYIGSVSRTITFKTCDCPSQEILECINKCHTALLDKCQELVMGVSVDIFCAWSEYLENGKSMQKSVGELCFHTRTKLLGINSVAEHPIIAMLQQISCKPEDLNDVVRNSDTETIMRNINSSDDKAMWLRALLGKENLYQDEILVNCIVDNLKYLNQDEFLPTYKSVKSFMSNNPESHDYLEKLIVKLFEHCPITLKHEILDDYFSNNCFINMTETDEFSNIITETFNKLIIAPAADLSDIMCLFLQNPHKVYTKIFELAAENAQQTNIMLNAMKLFEKFTNHYYDTDTEPCLIRVAENGFENLDTDLKKNNFISFICALKSCNSITGTKLLLLIIMPHIHKALLSKDIPSLNVQCKLLHDAYTLEELLQYRAPMLAMLGQILDIVRWKINTFLATAPETLQLTLDLQSTIFNTYSSDIPENEHNWLKNKLRNMQPLNMFYYRKLWAPPGNTFVEVIIGINIVNGMNTEQLVTRMSQVLCSTTQREWCEIWDSLLVLGDTNALDAIHNAMSLLTLAEQANRTDKSRACILYCYRNFVYTVRYKFLKEPLSDSQVSSVVDKVVITSNLIEEDSIEDFSTVLMPLFAYLAEKKNDYSFDVSQHLSTKLRHPKFTDILTKVFSNGAV